MQGRRHRRVAQMVSQGNKVKVVARGVAFQDQYAFDAQNFGCGGYGDGRAQVLYDDGFQWCFADQLAYAGLNPVEAAQDLYRALHTGGFPACDRLQLCQHRIKTTAQIGQHMVGVPREAVVRVHG